MESFLLPSSAYPPELREITLALWHTNKETASRLRTRLIQASTTEGADGDAERKRLDFAFLDGKMIACKDQLMVAAHSAILSAAQGELRTQTVHSEIIDHLNPQSNIGEGLKRFGISPKSESIILVRVGKAMSGDERARLQAEMQELTQGTLGSLDDLEKTADMKALNKLYKMGVDTLTPKLLTTYTALNKTVGVF